MKRIIFIKYMLAILQCKNNAEKYVGMNKYDVSTLLLRQNGSKKESHFENTGPEYGRATCYISKGLTSPSHW